MQQHGSDTRRVLLINPATPDYLPNKEFIMPQALLCLAAVLERAAFEPEILDLNTFRPWENPQWPDNWWQRPLMDSLDGNLPLMVGIGCLFSGQFKPVRRIASFIKAHHRHLPIVTGGMHPTVFAGQILKNCPEIDYVVIGEGEAQVVHLAQWLASGRRPAQVDGLAWRRDEGIILYPKKKYIKDLDSLPLPAYHLVDFQKYRHDTSCWHNPYNLDFQLSVPLLSSRSCPNRCNFCSMYQVMGKRFRPRSPKAVVDEIELLYHRYGQVHFSFMDDNLNLKKSHILSICRRIIQRGLKIEYETPNGLSTAHLDEEIIDAMVASGWVRGAIAIESGSDFIRNKVMGKRLPREKIFQVVDYARRYPQLYLKAYFIIGMPEETHASLEATYRMIEQLDLDEVYVTNLMPFHGTAVFDQALKDGLFSPEMNLERLWESDGFHYHDNRRFYIKPYAMDLEDLARWRRRFDRLLEEMASTRHPAPGTRLAAARTA